MFFLKSRIIFIFFVTIICLFLLCACQTETHTCSFGDGEIVLSPSCTDQGKREFKCSCGKTITQMIPALEHITETVDNCEKCILCGEITHTYHEVVYAINNDGVSARVCSYRNGNDHFHHVEISDTYKGLPVTSIARTDPNDEFYDLSVKDGVFFGGDFSSITIPDSVQFIEESTFSGCSFLEEITLPNGITSINDSLFRGAYSLSSITIPDSVTKIGNAAFSGCRGLTSISLPKNVTYIDNFAFNNSGLTNLPIHENITYIGQAAFESNKLTNITIPNSVTYIGPDAFVGNDLEMTDITFENASGWYTYPSPIDTVAALKAHLMNGKRLERESK